MVRRAHHDNVDKLRLFTGASILKKKDKQKIVEEISGAWSSDPTIKPIFKKIECDRHKYFGRSI
jgi:uncharacterized phage-associated protein